MTFELPLWARSLLTVLLVPVLSLATPAFAADEEDEAVEEEIVVTGSRVKRSDFTSASPITVITGQSILESGFSNLGEALRSQAVAGTAGFNQSSVLSGGGASSVDLRNLGQSRVLVLINGKRVASFADSLANQAVDLQFLPNSMVERVDILRDGASAIYGSDAISGVVNVILKERFEGIEAGVSSGISGEGDGESYTANFVMGTTSDRGSLMLGGEYYYQNNINQRDRDWAFPTISGLSAAGATNGSFFSPGGVYFGNNGSLYCSIPKAFGGDEVTNDLANCPSFLSNQQVGSPGEVEALRYDYGLRQDLYNSNEVYTMAGYGVYEITDGIEAFMEMQYAKRRGESNLDGNPGSFGTPSFPNGSFVPGTNPYVQSLGLGEGFYYFRPSSTIGTRRSNQESDTIRMVTGLRGDVLDEGMFEGWSWELSYLYTRVDADLRTNSTWNLARFSRIVDPDACALDPICAAAVNPAGALDVARPGNWLQSEIEYMRQNTLATAEFQTTGWFGLATGPVLELPAGEVHVAVGFEQRTDRGFAKPDSVTEAGESVANQTFTSQGNFSVTEFFAEVDIPVAADLPGVEQLDLNLQARTSDYNTFGSEDVWRAGINWQIYSDLRLRASMSTAYRSPQITDLFGGGTVSFDFFTHPCVDPVLEANVAANCALQGIPQTANQVSAQFAVLAGSNPNLSPETADTSTIGLIFTPSFLEGFSISIDYWDIEVDDLISRLTSDSIVDACYEGPVGLTADECSQFVSVYNASTNNLTIGSARNALTNLDSVSTDGYDVGIAYEFDVMDAVVNLDFQGTYVKENTFYPGAGGADDRGSIPRIRGNFNANVDWQSWDFGLRARYIHGMDDPRFDGNNVFGYSDVDAHTEIDLRASYNWDKYRATLGVNDVFDNDPPYVFSSGNNTDLFLYDARGRYVFLRLSASL